MKSRIGIVAVVCAMALALGLAGCSSSSEEASDTSTAATETTTSETQAEALVVDEAAKTITITATATGNTDSAVHLLANAEGKNAAKAFFTTEATPEEVYDAIVSLGGIPGNNIAVDDKDGTVLGSGLEVEVTADGADYGVYDLIDASEERTMDMRFGGNIAINNEYGTGCILCMESCSIGICSDAAYEYCEEIEFVPSADMPEAGTEVTFTLTVDDTTVVVNEGAGTVSLNAVATGFDGDSTIHAVGNVDGSNAEKAIFNTDATPQEVYDALVKLGAVGGENIAVEDADGTIEGTDLEVTVEEGAETYAYAELFTDSASRDFQPRFGGNGDINEEYGTGCIMCLESCSLGIISNAAYQYKEEATFAPTSKVPAKGTHVIVTFAIAE